jgi:hypothetical protein
VPGVWKSAPKLLCESEPAMGNEVVGETGDTVTPPVIQEPSTTPVNGNTAIPPVTQASSTGPMTGDTVTPPVIQESSTTCEVITQACHPPIMNKERPTALENVTVHHSRPKRHCGPPARFRKLLNHGKPLANINSVSQFTVVADTITDVMADANRTQPVGTRARRRQRELGP